MALSSYRIGRPKAGRGRADVNWRRLFEQAQKRGWPISEIARRAGVTTPTVRRYAKHLSLTVSPGSPVRRSIDWGAELDRALAAGETTEQLAGRLRVSRSAVDQAKRRLGVRLPHATGAEPVCADWAAMLEQAVVRGERQADLARRLGVRRQTVAAAALRLGIQLPRRETSPKRPSSASRDDKIAKLP